MGRWPRTTTCRTGHFALAQRLSKSDNSQTSYDQIQRAFGVGARGVLQIVTPRAQAPAVQSLRF
jgi:hypothetical protein